MHVQQLQIVHQSIKAIVLVEPQQNNNVVPILIAKIQVQQMEFVLINAKVQHQMIVSVDLQLYHIVIQHRDAKIKWQVQQLLFNCNNSKYCLNALATSGQCYDNCTNNIKSSCICGTITKQGCSNQQTCEDPNASTGNCITIPNCINNFDNSCQCGTTQISVCSESTYCTNVSDSNGVCLQYCNQNQKSNCICGSINKIACSQTQVCQNPNDQNGNCIEKCQNNLQTNCLCGNSVTPFCSVNEHCLDVKQLTGTCVQQCNQFQNNCVCGTSLYSYCSSTTYCSSKQQGICLEYCSSYQQSNCICGNKVKQVCSNGEKCVDPYADNGICNLGICTSQFQSNCTCGTTNQAHCKQNQYCLDSGALNGICFEKCQQNQNNCLCGIDSIDICFSSTYCLLQSKGVCMQQCTSVNNQNCLILSENQACLDQFNTVYNDVTGICIPTCKENGETNCYCGSTEKSVDQKLICQSGFECQNLETQSRVCVQKCTSNKTSNCYCGQEKSQYCNEDQTCQDQNQQVGLCKQSLNVQTADYSRIINLRLFAIICLFNIA
ncbi:unnamed protein product [Paramecium primaurelia]|uniref:Uncharacterized protein n=1 Tax=Paramecium primaurelia TaxID=5886 RepID=A0A8S1N7A8_PARPR|nr:unnamed protein product [Paramecium primaurelia]